MAKRRMPPEVTIRADPYQAPIQAAPFWLREQSGSARPARRGRPPAARRPVRVSGVELRELQYFVVVSEELHFARSAQRLHIARSAVSERIKRLEDELGVRLFDCTSRRVRLTRDGRQLLAGARRVTSPANQRT